MSRVVAADLQSARSQSSSAVEEPCSRVTP